MVRLNDGAKPGSWARVVGRANKTINLSGPSKGVSFFVRSALGLALLAMTVVNPTAARAQDPLELWCTYPNGLYDVAWYSDATGGAYWHYFGPLDWRQNNCGYRDNGDLDGCAQEKDRNGNQYSAGGYTGYYYDVPGGCEYCDHTFFYLYYSTSYKSYRFKQLTDDELVSHGYRIDIDTSNAPPISGSGTITNLRSTTQPNSDPSSYTPLSDWRYSRPNAGG